MPSLNKETVIKIMTEKMNTVRSNADISLHIQLGKLQVVVMQIGLCERCNSDPDADPCVKCKLLKHALNSLESVTRNRDAVKTVVAAMPKPKKHEGD